MAATSGTESFFVSWWYSPDTKLGIYFNSFGVNQPRRVLSADVLGGLDNTNGMSASIEEVYRYQNLITVHPVESSPAISDHIIRQPNIVSVTGIITSLLTVPIIGTSLIDFGQLGTAVELLTQMAESTSGLTLQTGLLYGTQYKRYNNLAVQSLDLPRTNQYGRSSIKFTIVFQELIVTLAADNVVQPGTSSAVPSSQDIA